MKENYFCGLFIAFMWYAITFLIYFDILFNFEMKGGKVYLLQEE